MEQKPTINYADFAKLDLRVGTIESCEEVENSQKLLKLEVNLGELGNRTILSGIKKHFPKESLIGKQVLVLVNLEPKKMADMMSEGMILMGVETVGEEETVTLLVPEGKVGNGTGVE